MEIWASFTMQRQLSRVLFLTVCVGLTGCLNGPQAVFHPVQLAARDYRPPPAPLEDLFLHLPDGTKIHARWCPHPRGQGAILYCPGATGNLQQRAGQVQALLQAVEESVLIFDYPGYGFSEGQPSLTGCCAAAEAAYHWLCTFKHLSPERLILYGETLGGTIALELGSRQPARALVLVCPLLEIKDKNSPPNHLATTPDTHLHLDCQALVQQCHQPIFLALENHSKLAQRLAAQCAAHGEVFYLPSGHRHMLSAEFYQRLRRFLQTHPPQMPAASPAATGPASPVAPASSGPAPPAASPPTAQIGTPIVH